MAQSLSFRMSRAALWVVSAQLLVKFSNFLIMIVLARILLPEDFGLVAMAMSIILIMEAVTELPLFQALVSLKKIEHGMYDTAFCIALVRGFIIVLTSFIVAVPIAIFFDDMRVSTLLCVMSFAPAFRGLKSPVLASHYRSVDYKIEFTLALYSRAATLIVTISIALLTRSYWSIAIGSLVGPVLYTILSYYLAPYKPRFSFQHWQIFKEIIGWNAVSQFFSALNWQVGFLMLGRFVGPTHTGMYSMAMMIVSLPTQVILQPLANPLISALSIALRQNRLASVFLQSSNTILAVVAPVLIIMIMLANPIVYIVLGSTWIDVAALLQWFSIAVLLSIPVAMLRPLAMASGNTFELATRNFLEFALLLPLTYLGVSRFGLLGAAYARVIAAVAMLVLHLLLVKKITGISLYTQISSLGRTCISIILMFAVLWIGNTLWIEPGNYHISTYFITPALITLSISFYTFTQMLCWYLQGMPEGIERRVFTSTRTLIAKFAN